jgi:anaerobic magnesium-protoporphyrin IX monomethyl ester cyclase
LVAGAAEILLGKGHAAESFCPFETSRGCPEKCIFCSTSKFFGHRFRAKSASRVIKEITDAAQNYGVEEIQFSDDNIALDRKRFLKICEGIEGLGLHLCCPNGIRLDYIREDDFIRKLFVQMKKTGFYQVSFAIESGNEYILNKVIRKRLDLNRVKIHVKMAQDAGLKVHGFFIVGLPGERREQIQETLDYARKLKADSYSFSIATPFPGTDLWDWCVRENLFKDGFQMADLMFGKAVIKRSDDLTLEGLEKLAEDASAALNKKESPGP